MESESLAPTPNGGVGDHTGRLRVVSPQLVGRAVELAAAGHVDALMRSLEPHSTGRTFVNLHGVPRDRADRARPWPEATYRRLRELKAAHDPANLFRFRHAIG